MLATLFWVFAVVLVVAAGLVGWSLVGLLRNHGTDLCDLSLVEFSRPETYPCPGWRRVFLSCAAVVGVWFCAVALSVLGPRRGRRSLESVPTPQRLAPTRAPAPAPGLPVPDGIE